MTRNAEGRQQQITKWVNLSEIKMTWRIVHVSNNVRLWITRFIALRVRLTCTTQLAENPTFLHLTHWLIQHIQQRPTCDSVLTRNVGIPPRWCNERTNE